MNKSSPSNIIVLVIIVLLSSIFIFSCKKTEDPIKFAQGTFPDTVMNLADINSAFDDYNLSVYQLNGNLPIVFSSNRRSLGGQFDLEQASISFAFDQTTGAFRLEADMTNDAFLNKLINKANTNGNDFGPFRLFSTLDGFEYLIISSVNREGNLDLIYYKNRPTSGSNLPDIEGPYPVKLLNTSYDDAYLCFDSNLDSVYFVTNEEGSFDIYMNKRPEEKEITEWFSLDYAVSLKVDSINSTSDDKCPLVIKKVMVFASDRPGGLGGFDLYYSLSKNGKWGSPVNLGPGINTSSDEYRPIINSHPDFTNLFMFFSSNRSGGKGGYDLYFTGIKFPDK
jgi:hypothetical protein